MFNAKEIFVLKSALEKAKIAWELKQERLFSELEYSRINKSDPGKTYWHEERLARLKYEATKALVEEFFK
jgi:uncharacterized Zn finger protein